jgi:uncharacterized protein (TIGR03083 family)
MNIIPIPTLALFEPLEAQLIQLLQSLSKEDWNKPTIVRGWTVKDIAAHLLDTSVRSIANSRDAYINKPENAVDTYADLLLYLNRMNADWVNAMKRVSPEMLTAWIASSSKDFIATFFEKDPFTPAVFPVAWAGDTTSPHWFHTAREFTERWHHQQQIREAVNKPGILTRQFYYPVLDTFMMALPYNYKNIEAKANTVIEIVISGEAGGNWFLTKQDKWLLGKGNELPVAASVHIDGNIAWKLFTKSWRKKDAMPYISVKGNIELAMPVLEMVAVMA